MKKILLTLIMFFALTTAHAQFINSFGAMVGVTYARQKWWINDTTDNTLLAEEKHKYLLRYNGCLFIEFFQHNVFRWRTEFQYNQKGTKLDTANYKLKQNYICWNNFLIIRFPETYWGTPYLLGGPRVEYLHKDNFGDFEKLHFSWSAGLGWEFITFGQLKPIAELHYNPDINPAYKQGPLTIKNRVWELRAGVKFVMASKKDCPAAH